MPFIVVVRSLARAAFSQAAYLFSNNLTKPLASFPGPAQLGHMEKQETEMKQKLEMETGNGNRKLKTEMPKRNLFAAV